MLMRQYEITQYAADFNGRVLYSFSGSDLRELRKQAAAEHARLAALGVPLLPALCFQKEILPITLSNIARYGQGQSRRKARRLLRSGKYTGNEELSVYSGRWELPKNS